MPDLNSLVIFAKVVQAKSFSEAARRLKMPLATVSRRIADLEDELGVRILERSTRSLRLTDIGAEVLEYAQRGSGLSDAVESVVSNHQTHICGLLRIAAPQSIAEPLLGPLLVAFQASYPDVHVQVTLTERSVDPIEDNTDLVFRIGALKDSSLVARKIVSYRHQLVASPDYVRSFEPPENPTDLLKHRLLAFSHWNPRSNWDFVRTNGQECESLDFLPHLSMNDSSGLTPALLAGAGIGELPPGLQQQLISSGQLVEVMPRWRFRPLDVSLVHLGNRQVAKAVRVFNALAAQMAPTLFPAISA
jgi:DNA-binding transcriptional LysR family regulator